MLILVAIEVMRILGTAHQMCGHGQQTGSTSEKAEALVRDLGSDDPGTRDQADRKLRKLGKRAEAMLTRAAESSDVEVKWRAQAILDWLRVLKVDSQGRVLVERDSKGWDVEYSRDEAGKVVRKTWVNPGNNRETYVRLYAYEAASGRLAREMDPAGRQKSISYRPGGTANVTTVEEGFVEETEQVSTMPPPRKLIPVPDK